MSTSTNKRIWMQEVGTRDGLQAEEAFVATDDKIALVNALSDADLSDAAFPFGTSRQISLGYATVRATRITYVGELGWEIYVPTEFAVGVYEDLLTAGAEFGVARGGYYAIESLRLESPVKADFRLAAKDGHRRA